jgi:hypothetical protein
MIRQMGQQSICDPNYEKLSRNAIIKKFCNPVKYKNFFATGSCQFYDNCQFTYSNTFGSEKKFQLMKLHYVFFTIAIGVSISSFVACSKSKSNPYGNSVNPDKAPVASVDRFSQSAGTLQVRTSSNGLPGPNVPVNFDKPPFITMGLTPTGGNVSYYNFDIRPTVPAPIYVLFKQGQTQQVPGQLNIIDVLPGETGYNDFWQVNMVTVPDDYVANNVTSYDEIVQNGFQIQKTNSLVNCPVVPKGSTASLRFANGDTSLSRGWYKDQVVYYLNFSEKALQVNSSGQVAAPSSLFHLMLTQASLGVVRNQASNLNHRIPRRTMLFQLYQLMQLILHCGQLLFTTILLLAQ